MSTRTVQVPPACPPWCAVDHNDLELAAGECRIEWREHRSDSVSFRTDLGDLVSVQVLAGDDLQTCTTGPNELVVRTPRDPISPADAQRLAAILAAVSAYTEERLPERSAGGGAA